MIPTDPARRKKLPIVRGLLDYFPLACLAVADVSRVGNEQHNPGQPMHWARGKSTDQEDTMVRHLMERGKFDVDGVRHSAKMAWRALALLQLEIEADQGAISLADMPTNNFSGDKPIKEPTPTERREAAEQAADQYYGRGPTVEETIAETPTCNICGERKWTPEGHRCMVPSNMDPRPGALNLDVV